MLIKVHKDKHWQEFELITKVEAKHFEMIPEKLQIKKEENQENIIMEDNRDSNHGSVDYRMTTDQANVTDTQGIIPHPESQLNSGKETIHTSPICTAMSLLHDSK